MYAKGKAGALLAVLTVAILVIPSGVAQFSDAGTSYTVNVSAENGTVLDVSTGEPFVSGSAADSVQLMFVANSGHEFVKWNVNGDCTKSENGCTISLSNLKEDVSVEAVSRNYSTSQELFTVVDSYGTPVPGDSLVKSWAFASTGLNRDTEGMAWEGMPSTPLIVGDAVYVRAGGILYKLDIDTGSILKSVESEGKISYYHYLSYGNGVIFDTVGSKAYDLDLVYLYDIPSNLEYASYHDGYFYGCLRVVYKEDAYYTMFKTSTDINKDLRNGMKVNLFKDTTEYRVFAQYGQFSNVMFENGYFFFLQSDGKEGEAGWRALTAVDLETGKGETKDLTGFTGMLWDEGWLSYYNGYFYLTAYTAGLFGGVRPGLEDKYSSVMWVKFDFTNGTFGTPSYQNIETAEGNTFRGIASGLEIHDGRGYINVRSLGTDTTGGSDDVGTCMISFDIGDDGRPIPREKASSPMTHGGIVVNTAYDSEGKRYIYLLPYNAGNQGLYVFTDELKDGKWTLHSTYSFMAFDESMNEYCSQAVRMGPSGELVFYLDSGYIQCYKAASQYQITVTKINDGFAEVGKACGDSIDTVLSEMYPGSALKNGQLTVGSKTYDIYGLNSIEGKYTKLIDPVNNQKYSETVNGAVISSHYSCYALVETGVDAHFSSEGDAGWYCIGGGEVKKCDILERDDIVGLSGYTLVYSKTVLDVDATFSKPYQTVARNGQITMELPSMFENSFEVDDSTVISAVLDGNSLTVTGLKEDTAVLTIHSGGQYTVTIDVTPYVYTDANGNTITESVTSRTSDGIRTDTVSKMVSNKAGSTSESTVKVYGSDGALQYTEKADKTVENDVISDYYPTKTCQKESSEIVRNDASGKAVSDMRYEKETILQNNQDATSTTYVIDSSEDKLKNVVTVTVTETTAAFDYTFVISTVSVSENGSDLTDREKTTYALSSDGKIRAELKDGVITLTAESNGSVGYSGLTKMLSGFGDGTYSITADGTVLSSVFDDFADLNAGMTLGDGNGSTILLDSAAMEKLKGKGDVEFSVSPATGLTEKQRNAAGDLKVLDITLKCGEAAQSEFGKITVTAVCDIALQDGKDLKVWHIDDYGKKTLVGNATYADGKVTFETDHLSLYAVGYETVEDSSSDGNSMMFIVIGVIVLLALVGAAFFLKKRKA